MPPYNPILGHLPVVARLMSKLPSDSSNQYLPGLLRRAYPDLGPNFYMDTWAFGLPVLFICEPSALHRITQEHSLPKHPDLREFLRPSANGLDIVTMEGPMWKSVREEHTRVLGSDLAERIRKLKEEPYLLKQLPYSTAVLKETMRLYPVASSLRGGGRDTMCEILKAVCFQRTAYLSGLCRGFTPRQELLASA